MSTTTTSSAESAPVGFFARKVAKVTGLSEMALDRLHTSDMGSPGHFLHLPGAEGGFFYTVAGLSRLVEILYLEGHHAEAVMLRRALDEIRRPADLPPAPKGRNVRGGWMRDWEDKKEAA